jgi:CheY-like chemotaxis protein
MRPNLLVVADDSITVQRVIELTFADEDIQVRTAGDVRQAIQCVGSESADVVLIDVSLPPVDGAPHDPGRDGYAVTEFVKQSPSLAGRTRVVLMTGPFEPIDQARADRMGVDAVLVKPFEPQVAIDLVKRLLGQAPARPTTDSATPPGPTPTGPMPPGTMSTVATAEKADALPVMAKAAGAGSSAAASGYPFEPEAGAPQSKSAELDEYFKRLDEALASAGHRPSTEAMAPATRKVKGRPMIDVQHSASTDVTLGDAFSALLAAEQGEPSAAALPASAFSASALVSEVAHPHLAPEAAPAPAAAAPVISEELLETVIRRVLEQMSDRLVRELVGPKVLDVAERLVREEIGRLRADADTPDQ